MKQQPHPTHILRPDLNQDVKHRETALSTHESRGVILLQADSTLSPHMLTGTDSARGRADEDGFPVEAGPEFHPTPQHGLGLSLPL